jgi:hypothetical protein
MDESQDQDQTAYGDNYLRLAQIKANNGPYNLLRINQNIKLMNDLLNGQKRRVRIDEIDDLVHLCKDQCFHRVCTAVMDSQAHGGLLQSCRQTCCRN